MAIVHSFQGIQLLINGSLVQSSTSTDNLLNPVAPQEFWVSWSRGIISVNMIIVSKVENLTFFK